MSTRQIVARYDYKDKLGKVRYQVVRYEPKTFAVRHPDGKGGWAWGLNGSRRLLFGLPKLATAPDAAVVFVAEGEKDVESLVRLGLIATTNSGGAKGWLPEFADELMRFHVVVLPDNDEPGRRHAEDVARSAAGKALSVKILNLPGLDEHEDVTDWAARGGSREELLRLVDDARAYSLSEAPPMDPEVYLKGGFKPSLIADEILRQERFISAPIDDGGRGVRLMRYAEGAFIMGEAEARTRAAKIMGDHAKPDRIDAVMGMLREKTKIEESRLNPKASDLINVSNGMLDWRTGKLCPHSPDFLSTCQINAVYEPEVDDDVMDKFLDAVLPKDDQRVIEEMMGYLLIPSTRFQVCFMLAGEGANGKSTFMDALAHMIGERNVSQVSLHDLASNRFMTAELQGKLVNIYPEVHHMDVDQTDVFKAIVTGNPIKAERKHGHPFKLLPHARLIFSANEMPRANDTTYGYFRRWMIVPFMQKFVGKGDDKNMLTKLRSPAARSAMLNRAVMGLTRLMRQEQFSRSPSIDAAVDQYRRQNDSIYDYIKDRIAVAAASEITKDGIFADYELWCMKTGVKFPFSRRVFNQRFPKLIAAREARTTMPNGSKPWVWRGIGLKPSEDGVLNQGRKQRTTWTR